LEKRTIRLVLADLTLGDLEAYENATGHDLMNDLQPKRVIDPETKMPVPDPDSPEGRPLLRVTLSAKTYLGLIYLGALRDDPSLKYTDVRPWKLADIDFHLIMEEESPESPLESEPPESESG
jgi:hypothetical protein